MIMNIIPLNSKLLKELLDKSNLTARLFKNDFNFSSLSTLESSVSPIDNCEDSPSLVIEQVSFNGYSSKFLNPMLWNATAQSAGSYIKYKYSSGIVWKNRGTENSEIIRGYYITNQNNEVLWFEKFDNEVILKQNEAILVNIETEINNYDFPQTTIALIIKNNNLTPTNTSIDIQNIKWGGIDYPSDYFLDLLNNNFIPQNNIICIGVKDKIKPCWAEPLQFDLSVSSLGFQNYQENISIRNKGNSIIEINLVKTTTTTTTIDPNLPPSPLNGIVGIRVANDVYDTITSSTLDTITVSAYEPIIDKFKDIIVNYIKFELSGDSTLIGGISLPDQLGNSAKMVGAFEFAGGVLGRFTITDTTTITSPVNGNKTFFTGTMNEDSAIGKWVLGDPFSADLTFKNSDLLKITNNGSNVATYYLYLKDFSFTVSGNRYYIRPLI